MAVKITNVYLTKFILLVGTSLFPSLLSAADQGAATNVETQVDRWALGAGGSTVWEVAGDSRLPHRDFIEQGGRLAQNGIAVRSRV